MIRISADRGSCIGAGQCVLSAPEVFDQDEQGYVTVIDDSPPGELADAVRLAGQLCPSRSITVHEG